MYRTQWITVALFVIGISVLFAPSIPTYATPRDAQVVFVADETQKRGCRLLIQDEVIANAQSTQEKQAQLAAAPPCVPGTVLALRFGTAADALASGISDYITLSGNQQKDNAAVEALFDRAYKRYAQQQHTTITPLASCTVANRVASAVYGAGSGTSVTTEFKYSVSSDCRLSNHADRAKRSGSLAVCWRQSGIGPNTSSYSIFTRNLSLLTAFSGWKGMVPGTTSYVGWWYTHRSNQDVPLVCETANNFTIYSVQFQIPG